MKFRNLGKYLLGAAVLGFATAASAETGTALDTAAVTAQYGEIETALVAVGSVIVSAAALAVGFKWIKGMIFS